MSTPPLTISRILIQVDSEKISMLGICAGGSYVVAAKGDHRLKVVTTVSMVDIGDSERLGWDGDEDAFKKVEALNAAAAAQSAEHAAAPYMPPQPDDKTPRDMREASDYYLTPRAQHLRAANKMLYLGFPCVLTFDAVHLADIFQKQPSPVQTLSRCGIPRNWTSLLAVRLRR
jgi:hypothetical protein